MISTKNTVYQIGDRWFFLKPGHKEDKQLFQINGVIALMTILVVVSVVDANCSVIVRQILKSKQVVYPTEITIVEACIVETILVVPGGKVDVPWYKEKKGLGRFFKGDVICRANDQEWRRNRRNNGVKNI